MLDGCEFLLLWLENLFLRQRRKIFRMSFSCFLRKKNANDMGRWETSRKLPNLCYLINLKKSQRQQLKLMTIKL